MAEQALDRSTVRNEPSSRDSSSRHNEQLSEFLEWFQRRLEADYGGMFTSRVDSIEKQAAWESLWTQTFSGKTPSRIRKALDACFASCKEAPFTTAHFEEQYRALPADETARRQLPPPPISDREVVQEYLESLRGILRKRGTVRTERNIASGKWTDEMERRFQRDLKITGFGKQRISGVPLAGHVCGYPDCGQAGVFSGSVTGSSTWYCARHWRR
jgi:hypothetical protein